MSAAPQCALIHDTALPMKSTSSYAQLQFTASSCLICCSARSLGELPEVFFQGIVKPVVCCVPHRYLC